MLQCSLGTNLERQAYRYWVSTQKAQMHYINIHDGQLINKELENNCARSDQDDR